MKGRSITFFVTAVALTGLLAGSALAASAVAAKPSLKVTVSGKGRVTSSPAGIACPRKCTVGFKAGTSVRLVAHPAAGWKLTKWTGACKGAGACSVKLSAAKSVHAVFGKKPTSPPPPPPSPPPPPPTPPPPPPPPSFKTGAYSGTTSQGKALTFNVSTDGKTVSGINTIIDLNCTEVPGFTVTLPLQSSGDFNVNSDLTFDANEHDVASDGTTLDITFHGLLTASSGASGSLRVDVSQIPGVPGICSTGDTTWTAS